MPFLPTAGASLPGPGLPAAPPQAAALPVTVGVDAASPAGRSIDEGLIGTNQSYGPAGSLVKAIGPDWARTDTSFQGTYDGKPVYNCATGAWNPVLLSQGLAADAAEGGTPEVIVDYSPTCLTTSVPPGTNPSYAPPDAGNWGPWDALVTKMGEYAISQGVRVFEVWNEPDWVFFDGNLPAYLQLYAHTAQALDAAASTMHVRIEIGGPATVTADPVWINALAKLAVSDHLPLDFVSWHDYASDPAIGPFEPTPIGEMPPAPPSGVPPYWYSPVVTVRQYALETKMVRKVLSRYPELHPKLVDDEWNLDAGYDPRMSSAYDAAFVAAVLQTAEQARLSKMAFFRVTDSQHGNPYDNWGMLAFDKAGNLVPKPVYWSFLFWHDLAGEQVGTSVLPPQQAGRQIGVVRAVASVPRGDRVGKGPLAGRARGIRVLVSNFTSYDPTGGNGTSDPNPYDHKVILRVSGLAPGKYEVARLAVDALDSGGPAGVPRTVQVFSNGRLEVPFLAYGYSANLVEITRAG